MRGRGLLDIEFLKFVSLPETNHKVRCSRILA